ncbi:hypothetical protein FBQ79_13895, partial [Anaerolineae bacterium AMX1]|nr:hypothetical protein [Anaerolineae bacterium AMX1]
MPPHQVVDEFSHMRVGREIFGHRRDRVADPVFSDVPGLGVASLPALGRVRRGLRRDQRQSAHAAG